MTGEKEKSRDKEGKNDWRKGEKRRDRERVSAGT